MISSGQAAGYVDRLQRWYNNTAQRTSELQQKWSAEDVDVSCLDVRKWPFVKVVSNPCRNIRSVYKNW